MLEELIQQVIAMKKGDKDFALFTDESGEWLAMLGNTCPMVHLGEADAEFEGRGNSARAAVTDLMCALTCDQGATA